MSTLAFWQLKAQPFAKHCPRLFLGGSVEEALARIDFLASSEGSFGLLIGPRNVGKSSLMHYLATRRPNGGERASRRTIHVSAAGLGEEDILGRLTAQLGDRWRLPPTSSVAMAPRQAWRDLEDRLAAISLAGGKPLLCIDDFSDSRTDPVFLRRLQGCTGSPSILLALEAEAGPFPLGVSGMADMRIDLPAWDLGQTADYFDFALGWVGGDPEIFEAQAITRIHELADGRPGEIRRLAELALVAGAAQRMRRIPSAVIEQVYAEFHPASCTAGVLFAAGAIVEGTTGV
jgi:type II secretory pathway predicted ATPase ExeA